MPKNKKSFITVDGNNAAALASYNFSEVAAIYPITPSSPMAEYVDLYSSQGKLNYFGDKVKVVSHYLPSEAWVGAIDLEPGSYTVEISFINKWGQSLGTITQSVEVAGSRSLSLVEAFLPR